MSAKKKLKDSDEICFVNTNIAALIHKHRRSEL